MEMREKVGAFKSEFYCEASMEMWTWVEYGIICKWESRRLLSFWKLIENYWQFLCTRKFIIFRLLHYLRANHINLFPKTFSTSYHAQQFMYLEFSQFRESLAATRRKKTTNLAVFIQFRDFFCAVIDAGGWVHRLHLGTFLSAEFNRRHDK